jgi:16S rRNA (cytosine967-C5)-methyltransferase
MNEPATVTTRDDGYVQDRASQWVAELVEARAGDRVLDVCAAPGGKATAMARAAATVVAADVRAARGRLVRDNTRRLHLTNVAVVAAEGRQPPFSPATFDRVLVDAPCSNLGALRRRPDARWRVEAEDVDRLAALQRDLLAAAAPLVRPGGRLVFAVCTLTATETVAVDDWVAKSFPGLRPVPPPSPPWRSHGRGALLLPHAAGTDGMALFRYERTGCAEA